jgi:hypothetical protein
MSVLMNSFVKSVAVTMIVVAASLGSTFLIDPSAIFIPQHQFEFELSDASGDTDIDYIDIVEYGSFRRGSKVVLYLEVATQINLSATYQLFIVAKTPNDDIAHIYNNAVSNGVEKNYQSEVTIDNNRLEVAFSTARFIANSYMVGLETRALAFASEDTTSPARENPLKTRFLGIF